MKFLYFLLLGVVSFENSVQSNVCCDHSGKYYYDQRGCTPHYIKGKSCPSYYTCDRSIENKGVCTYWNNTLQSDENFEQNCQNIFCNVQNKTKPGVLNSFYTFCFIFWPTTDGCTGIYNTLNSCCGSGENCETNSNICYMDGKYHNEDEVFVRRDKCESCICTKDLTDESYKVVCEPMMCPFHSWQPEKIAKNCAPVYQSEETPCCPSSYICEDDNIKISGVTVNENIEGKTCAFAGKYFTRGSKFSITSSTGALNCKCELPPNPMCTTK